jgi:hypothetical protein
LKPSESNTEKNYLDNLPKSPEEEVWDGIVSKLEQLAKIEYELSKVKKQCKT